MGYSVLGKFKEARKNEEISLFCYFPIFLVPSRRRSSHFLPSFPNPKLTGTILLLQDYGWGSIDINITLCSPLTDTLKVLKYNELSGLDSPGGVKC